jgi:hypothetical protein
MSIMSFFFSSLFQSFLCADRQVEGVLGPGNGGRVHLWRWVMHEVTLCDTMMLSAMQTTELVQLSKVSIHLTQESSGIYGQIWWKWNSCEYRGCNVFGGRQSASTRLVEKCDRQIAGSKERLNEMEVSHRLT